MWNADGDELQCYCSCVGSDAPHAVTVKLSETSVCSDLAEVVVECLWCGNETTLR